MRQFDTGATRDSDDSKLDYEGFLHPRVLESYAEYMHSNRFQADGRIRDSDNWQKGIPKDVYIKSMFRHFFDVWKEHRGLPTETGMQDSLNALLFNVMGYMFEHLREEEGIVEGKFIITETSDMYREEFNKEIEKSLAGFYDVPEEPEEGEAPPVFSIGDVVRVIGPGNDRERDPYYMWVGDMDRLIGTTARVRDSQLGGQNVLLDEGEGWLFPVESLEHA
jgi:hypothetical protein